MSKLILGCGYLGSRVAAGWHAAGHEVFAVTRSAHRAAELERQGLRPIIADVADASSLDSRLPTAETVLYAIGYDASSGRTRDEVQIAGLRQTLDALPADTGRIVFISSTGVYGQTTGRWVDEESPCEPTREAGRTALAAEVLLRAHPLGNRAIILRLAGIYGPGRIPHYRDIAADRPIAAEPNSHLNLIHVEDAAATVFAAESRGQPPRLYLVSDGQPVRRGEYVAALCDHFKLPPAQFAPPPPDVLAQSRSGTDKLISNARLVSELNPAFRFPSYRDGLAALIERG
jgi:nucleoside-diphosphate-sugar epimerase